MRGKFYITCTMLFLLALPGISSAQMNQNQTINVTIQPISEIKLNGGAITLTINDVAAGSDPTPVTNATLTYNISTNKSNQRITGSLQEGTTPANTTLTINMAAPSTGGSSAGNVPLGTTAIDLVTGIPPGKSLNRPITFTFSATIDAGIVASIIRTVILTLSD